MKAESGEGYKFIALHEISTWEDSVGCFQRKFSDPSDDTVTVRGKLIAECERDGEFWNEPIPTKKEFQH